MADFDMPKAGTWEQRGGWVVRRLVADLGLSLEQAAGVTGNLGYESAGFTKLQEIAPAVHGSRGGFGFAQWTGPRRIQFEAWCAAHNLPPASDDANYGFLLEELTGSYKSFTAKLKQCVGIEDACRLTHRLYETPSDVLDGSYRSGPDRLRWAQRALAGAQAEPGGASAPGRDNPAGDACAAGGDVDRDLLAAGARAFNATAAVLQRLLRDAGYYDGAIDGDFGPGSRAALKAYLADSLTHAGP